MPSSASAPVRWRISAAVSRSTCVEPRRRERLRQGGMTRRRRSGDRSSNGCRSIPISIVSAAEMLAISGELDDAATEYEKAASLGAGPVVQQRLAEVYAQLGRREESEQARRAYERKVKELLKVNPPARP